MSYSNICPKELLQHMISVDRENTLLRKLRDYTYYIEDDDVENMDVLYHLYSNYKEMNKIIKTDIPNEESFMKYANNCADKYKELEKKCVKPSKHFCKALYAFKKKYDDIDLKNPKLEDWEKKKLPSLSKSENAE
ncbi:hypothetical protein PCYB_007880, partial [Plasmodium cynomolgi strain B]